MLIHTKDYQQLSEMIADRMIAEIKNNPKANICLASGGSYDLAYTIFTEKVIKEGLDLSECTFTKLDEWAGISLDSELSCEQFLIERVIKPLNIKKEQYISFCPDVEDLEKECARIHDLLKEKPIDLCLLGLGKNGHLGLNEPNDYLHMYAHEVVLTEETKKHAMLKSTPMEKGITIGMKEIFDSKEVILAICGNGKDEIVKNFMTQRITTSLPASLLWLHPHCNMLIQDDQYGKYGK